MSRDRKGILRMKLTRTLTPAEIQQAMTEEDPWEKEMDAANAFIAEHPDSAEGYIKRARLHEENDCFDAAMADANKAIELAPNSPEAHAVRGGLFINYYFGDPEQAHRECAIAMALLALMYDVRLTPRDSDEKSPGELKAIIKQATKEIRKNKYSYAALIRRARANDGLGETKKRNRDLAKAIHFNMNTPNTYLVRAELRDTEEHDTRVKTDVEKAYKLDPTRPEGYLTLARLYFHAGADLSDYALEAIAKTISIDKNCAGAYYYRGRIQFNRGQHEKALTDFRKTLKLDPEFAPGYLSLAVCAEAMGLLDEAQAAYEGYIARADKMEVLSIIDAIKAVEMIQESRQRQQGNAR
jgi:tetratricopeptide (TPR) repeat protein